MTSYSSNCGGDAGQAHFDTTGAPGIAAKRIPLSEGII